MPNPFVKLWKYLTASANAQIDQRADPKIQIAQAIEAEQQRHQALANQAAAVLGNQRQLEMRLNRQLLCVVIKVRHPLLISTSSLDGFLRPIALFIDCCKFTPGLGAHHDLFDPHHHHIPNADL